MKQNTYHVHFKIGLYKVVRAFNEEEAKILAQAERIKECKDYNVERIDEVK